MDVITSELRVGSPDVQSFIPSRTVDELVARADRELAELEARAAAEVALAERLEAAIVAEGADPHLGPWAMVQLHTFLDRLLLELGSELQASIGVARQMQHSFRGAPVDGVAAKLPTTPLFDESVMPAPDISVTWWDTVTTDDEAAREGRSVAPEPAEEPAAAEAITNVVEGAPEEDATAQSADSFDWAKLGVESNDTPDVEEVASAVPDQQFWADEKPAPGRSLFARRRASTVLQIGAGLLVIAAALLHFA